MNQTQFFRAKIRQIAACAAPLGCLQSQHWRICSLVREIRERLVKTSFVASAITILAVIRHWSHGGILLICNNLFPSPPLSSLSLTLLQSEAFPQQSTLNPSWLQRAWRKAHVALEITLPYQLSLDVEDPLALASPWYRHISFLTFIIASNENCLII